MLKNTGLSALITLLICSTNLLSAEENPSGNTEKRYSFSLGFDANYMHYEETVNGRFLDKDTGWLGGIFSEFRYDSPDILYRINYQYSYTGSAQYDGSLQDGTPYRMTTPEELFQIELNLGIKAVKISNTTTAFYAGLGYRHWFRGQNVSPDYLEEYSWMFGELGVNFSVKYNSWLIAFDAAGQYTLNPKMVTGGETFYIKSKPGYRILVPVNYYLEDSAEFNKFIFIAAYFQRWNIGASDVVHTASGDYYEPDSFTNMFGIRFGLGVNF